MSDYRVVVKVQNGRIYERIREQSFPNISAFCKKHGLQQTAVGELLNMKLSPITKKGAFRQIVLDIANALQTDPADLFTERQYEPVPTNVKDFLLEEQHLHQLLESENNAEHRLALIEMVEGIQKRAHLTPREQQVITMRFKHDQTLDEVGKAFNLSKNRIREIEAKALRKMRRPYAVGDVMPEDLEEYATCTPESQHRP